MAAKTQRAQRREEIVATDEDRLTQMGKLIGGIWCFCALCVFAASFSSVSRCRGVRWSRGGRGSIVASRLWGGARGSLGRDGFLLLWGGGRRGFGRARGGGLGGRRIGWLVFGRGPGRRGGS